MARYNPTKDSSWGYIGGGIVAIIVYIIMLGVCLYGWVLNIITLFQATDAMTTGELIVRVVGIPIGIIGVVMGFI